MIPLLTSFIILMGIFFLLATSGKIIDIFVFKNIEKDTDEKKKQQHIKFRYKKYGLIEKSKMDKKDLDAGMIIGKCENILIVLFILLNQYTALAIIFGAKAIVRQEDIKKNSIYFLAGTLVNVTYSLIIGLLIKAIITYLN